MAIEFFLVIRRGLLFLRGGKWDCLQRTGNNINDIKYGSVSIVGQMLKTLLDNTKSIVISSWYSNGDGGDCTKSVYTNPSQLSVYGNTVILPFSMEVGHWYFSSSSNLSLTFYFKTDATVNQYNGVTAKFSDGSSEWFFNSDRDYTKRKNNVAFNNNNKNKAIAMYRNRVWVTQFTIS